MYDEPVKRIRQIAEEVCEDYDVDPYNAEQRCLAILEAADAIEELSKPRWIPVTERLPEEQKIVLCYCSRNGQYGCGEVVKNDRNTLYWIGLNGMIPTHWMPLPEPPKEG